MAHRLLAVPVIAVALAAAVSLAGCSSIQASASTQVSGSPAAATPAPPPVALRLAHSQRFDRPVSFSVTAGTLTSVTVTGRGDSGALPGTIGATGTRWKSLQLPVPGARYDVTATALGSDGHVTTLTGNVKITPRPSADEVGYWVTPGTGTTVGVNAPLVIRFDQDIKDRLAVQDALTVSSTTPVVGAWHWISSREVHFRPKTHWPAHSKVRLQAALAEVQVAPSRWTTDSTTVNLTVGDAHLTKVDGARHTVTVYVNGKLYATWPTSLGRPDFATRSGAYIVLEKQPSLRMTSCSAHITCDKANPNYYDLTVLEDVRLTWSGTFVHSAPWSVGAQGNSNVSHGCVNLSPAHAAAFYALAQYGDLVTVTGTIRGPADLLANGDPGMADWNVGWSAWLAGSATKKPVTTTALAG